MRESLMNGLIGKSIREQAKDFLVGLGRILKIHRNGDRRGRGFSWHRFIKIRHLKDEWNEWIWSYDDNDLNNNIIQSNSYYNNGVEASH